MVRSPTKHEAGEIDQSQLASSVFLSTEQRHIRYHRLRPAQRTQRRLPDQLWASIAWCPYLLSSPPSLPQKHVLRTWGLILPGLICFEKTDVAKMTWSCTFPLRVRHYPRSVCAESDLMAHRPHSRDAPPAEDLTHYLLVFSFKNRRTALLTWNKLWRVRLGARIWRIPPQDICDVKQWRALEFCTLVDFFQVLFLFGWNQAHSYLF